MDLSLVSTAQGEQRLRLVMAHWQGAGYWGGSLVRGSNTSEVV